MSSDLGAAESGVVELILTASPESEILEGFFSELDQEPDEFNILVVCDESSPDEVMSTVSTKYRTLPGEFGLINIGDTTRSPCTEQPDQLDSPAILTIIDDDDISRLGTTINLYLNQWADNEKRIRIFFNSLTKLLQTVSLQQLFRFLHLLTYRIHQTGSIGQFYLNPKNFDKEIIRTVEPLFDIVAGNTDVYSVSEQDGLAVVDDLNDNSFDSELRRVLISLLLENQTPVDLRKLTEWVIDRELERQDQMNSCDNEKFNQMYYSLYHIHIPKLVNAGLVVTDQSNELVEETRAAERIATRFRTIEE